MNSFFLLNSFSLKREATIIISAFVLVLSLPVIAIFILTNAGINVVSDHLVSKNIQTNAVEIHDPKTGKAITSLNNPMHWPVNGTVTLEFGMPDPPYQPLHTGIDIANAKDTPVTPFMDGAVIYAGELSWGYGKHIIIDNGNNVSSVYAHLDKIYVYPGEKVTMDQVIGAIGETGWATGPHLHFEIRVFDIPVNPRTFLTGNP